MARKPLRDAVQDVADDGAGRRRHNPYARGQKRQPPLARFIEKPFRREFPAALLNNLALTRACVESLQATLPCGLAHEVILVDDGSTDGTRAWLKSLSSSNGLATLAPSVRVVLNEHNLGYAVANNRAAAAPCPRAA